MRAGRRQWCLKAVCPLPSSIAIPPTRRRRRHLRHRRLCLLGFRCRWESARYWLRRRRMRAQRSSSCSWRTSSVGCLWGCIDNYWRWDVGACGEREVDRRECEVGFALVQSHGKTGKTCFI